MAKFIDLAGRRFGLLTVVARHPNKTYNIRWDCTCDCGSRVVVIGGNMKNGHTTSCGCVQDEVRRVIHTTHGHCKNGITHPLYPTWNQMGQRCNRETHKQFADYGGRGIKVCERWKGLSGFKNFLEDMGARPDRHSIDRINNELGYSPENCRWADHVTQSNNKRSNRTLVTSSGKVETLANWSRASGVDRTTISFRIKVLNQSVDEAIQKIDRRKSNKGRVSTSK